MRVTVTGANGFLGLNVIAALEAQGLAPRCLHRPRSNLIPLRRRGLELRAFDLDLPASLAPALADSDVVVHTAAYYPRDSRSPEAAVARALAQTDALLDAAAAAGVARLVFVSSTATVAARADGRASTEADVFATPPPFGAYHAVKWAMEQRVAREDRMAVVVVCPGACIGPWDLRVGTSALVVAIARGVAPPYPDGHVSLVDARDVGRALAACALHPAPPPRVLVAAHDRRLHDLVQELARHYDVAAPRAPLSAERAAAFADAEEARVAGTSSRPAIAREIVDLVVHGARVDASLACAALGLAWTPWPDTLATFDAWARRMRLIPPAAPRPTPEPS